jgi:Protein of unknown function (DUF2892)
MEPMLRATAVTFVAAGVVLGMYVHSYFLWFTLFVGLNLLQSGFTKWCPRLERDRAPFTGGLRVQQAS